MSHSEFLTGQPKLDLSCFPCIGLQSCLLVRARLGLEELAPQMSMTALALARTSRRLPPRLYGRCAMALTLLTLHRDDTGYLFLSTVKFPCTFFIATNHRSCQTRWNYGQLPLTPAHIFMSCPPQGRTHVHSHLSSNVQWNFGANFPVKS